MSTRLMYFTPHRPPVSGNANPKGGGREIVSSEFANENRACCLLYINLITPYTARTGRFHKPANRITNRARAELASTAMIRRDQISQSSVGLSQNGKNGFIFPERDKRGCLGTFSASISTIYRQLL